MFWFGFVIGLVVGGLAGVFVLAMAMTAGDGRD